jgi:hypothetical protein
MHDLYMETLAESSLALRAFGMAAALRNTKQVGLLPPAR